MWKGKNATMCSFSSKFPFLSWTASFGSRPMASPSLWHHREGAVLTKVSAVLRSCKRRDRRGEYVKHMTGKRSWGALGREEKNGLSGAGWGDKKDLKTTAGTSQGTRRVRFPSQVRKQARVSVTWARPHGYSVPESALELSWRSAHFQHLTPSQEITRKEREERRRKSSKEGMGRR